MTLYNDCTLPFPLFVRGTCAQDAFVVVIDGEPKTDAEHDAVRAAWLSVNSEYSELVGDMSVKTFARDTCRQAEIGSKILRVRLLVEAAKSLPMPGYLQALAEEGYHIDESNIDKTLDRVLNELKADEIDYDRISAKIEAAQQERVGNSEERPTEADFDHLMIMINRNEKIAYRPADLTTRQFAILFGDLKKAARKQPQVNEYN